MAIKVKSDFDGEQANHYFTLSVMGCIISCLVLMIGIFVFADPLLHILNIPSDIYESSKTYLLIATGFFTFNAYVQVLGYYFKSDGHAKMTLNEVIIANVLNLALNFILFKILGPHISSIALALEDIAKDIFVADDVLSEIDISVMVDDDYMMLRFIYDCELYNPFENDELLNGEHIRDLNNFNHAFNYHSMFDLNFSYSRTEYVAHLHQLIFLQQHVMI